MDECIQPSPIYLISLIAMIFLLKNHIFFCFVTSTTKALLHLALPPFMLKDPTLSSCIRSEERRKTQRQKQTSMEEHRKESTLWCMIIVYFTNYLLTIFPFCCFFKGCNVLVKIYIFFASSILKVCFCRKTYMSDELLYIAKLILYFHSLSRSIVQLTRYASLNRNPYLQPQLATENLCTSSIHLSRPATSLHTDHLPWLTSSVPAEMLDAAACSAEGVPAALLLCLSPQARKLISSWTTIAADCSSNWLFTSLLASEALLGEEGGFSVFSLCLLSVQTCKLLVADIATLKPFKLHCINLHHLQAITVFHSKPPDSCIAESKNIKWLPLEWLNMLHLQSLHPRKTESSGKFAKFPQLIFQ